jgi:hypothetical protein
MIESAGKWGNKTDYNRNQPSLLDEVPLREDAVRFGAHLSLEIRLSDLSGLYRVLDL